VTHPTEPATYHDGYPAPALANPLTLDEGPVGGFESFTWPTHVGRRASYAVLETSHATLKSTSASERSYGSVRRPWLASAAISTLLIFALAGGIGGLWWSTSIGLAAGRTLLTTPASSAGATSSSWSANEPEPVSGEVPDTSADVPVPMVVSNGDAPPGGDRTPGDIGDRMTLSVRIEAKRSSAYEGLAPQ
jgi:hypothetical protein